MNFTFGIITCAKTNNFLNEIVASIRSQNIPLCGGCYEIVVVGTMPPATSNSTQLFEGEIVNVPFDETSWITRKKNLVAQCAKYDNIVLMHDYVKLEEGWYEGFLKFGNHFDVCMNKVLNLTGERVRDYTLNPHFIHPSFGTKNILIPYSCNKAATECNKAAMECKITPEISSIMYVSGGYYVVKKSLALQVPLREKILGWNQGEDVFFSQDIADKGVVIDFNENSSVRCLKNKFETAPPTYEMSIEQFVFLKKWASSNAKQVFEKQKALQKEWAEREFGICF